MRDEHHDFNDAFDDDDLGEGETLPIKPAEELPQFLFDEGPLSRRLADVTPMRVNMMYDTGGRPPRWSPPTRDLAEDLKAAVQHLVALKLPKIRGFQFNVANRAFQVGLLSGAWVENATRSREREEVFRAIVEEVISKLGPVLNLHLPGRRWQLN